MDGWAYWVYLKISISVFAAIICVLSAVVIWRVRGILQWQRSLGAEIASLEKNAHMATGQKHLAISVVLQQCRYIRQFRSPDPRFVLHLDEYLRRIAACYYPDSTRPELCITLGQALGAATEMVDRLDGIVRRKGLRRFGKIRVRHIRKALAWYRKISQNYLFGWFLRHQGTLARMIHIQRFLLPDPFSWLVYFSNRLTILMLTRTLLLDIYLYVGNLAVGAYDPEYAVKEKNIDTDYLAETLATLYDKEFSDEWQNDSQVAQIRAQLVGLPKRMILPPTIDEWRQSVLKAANIIAKRHFSQSETPLEEAAFGPILMQLQSFLRSMGGVSRYAGVKQFFGVSLESLYSAHAFVGNVSGSRLTPLIQKAWGGYRTVRWPLKIFRWVKRSSPSGIAMDLGWETFRKGLINFSARFAFDRICKEIDILYKKSRKQQ